MHPAFSFGVSHELYRPIERHAVRDERTGRPVRSQCLTGLRRCDAGNRRSGTGRKCEVLQRSHCTAEFFWRQGAELLARRSGHDQQGLQGGIQGIRRSGMARRAASSRFRRSGPAEAAGDSVHRNAQFRQPVIRIVPIADRWCDRGIADRRNGRAKTDVPAEPDLRQMDRHNESDRAAGGIRSGVGAYTGGAAGRRYFQDFRHQDFHHVWRARHGGEHHPLRARTYAERTGRRERYFAIHRAEVPGQCRRLARRAQRCVLRVA